MRILAGLISLFLWLLAGLFVLAAMAPEAVAGGKVLPRMVVAGLLTLGGLVMAVFAFRSGAAGAVTGAGAGARSAQEPPGELTTRAVVCPHCGGKADAEAMKVGKDGVMTVSCPYCKTAFFVEEAPKW